MRGCRTASKPPFCLLCPEQTSGPQPFLTLCALQTLPHLVAHLLDPIYLTLVYHPLLLLWVQTHMGNVQPPMRAELC